MSERLVVVGGDAGGMSAASVVRRARPDVEIVVFERGHITSYAACGIPYVVAGEVATTDALVVRTPQQFAERDIDVRLGHEVVRIDVDERVVEARDLDRGGTTVLGFDQLMIGTGARPIVPDWPGVDLPHVSVAHKLPDADRIRDLAADVDGRPVAVVGGGYVGIEMAEALLARGARVTLLDAAPQLMGNLDPAMAARVAAAAERLGIDVRLEAEVEGITPAAVTVGGAEVPAELVVLGLGVRPNSELAAEAGLTTGVRGAIRVEPTQRTSVEGVYAAGDCAETRNRVSDRPTWIALGTVANKTARVAGQNLAGGHARFSGALGTAITRLVDTEIARTGLSTGEAEEAGFEPVATVVESTTIAGYMPESNPIAVQIVHDGPTGKLLGGQIVGGRGSAKRIDTIATALWGGLLVEELTELDLAYAPPFSGVWDPVNIAARHAIRPASS
jgi:NADPH-dependent 2,4-dienoyl-CoA reductase/sulfur reductase-like enzyme